MKYPPMLKNKAANPVKVVNIAFTPYRIPCCYSNALYTNVAELRICLPLRFHRRVVEVDEFPGIAAADPHFRRLERKGSVRSCGPVGLDHQRDVVVEAELLRINLAGNYFHSGA